MLRENLSHLRRRFHVVALILHPQPARISQLAPSHDARQRVLMRRILRIDVVTIIRHHQLDTHLVRQLADSFVHIILPRHPLVVHQLKVIPVAEHFLVPSSSLPRRLHFAIRPQHITRQLARHTSRQHDHTLGILSQQIAVDTRPVVKPLQMRLAGKLKQIAIASQILRQQRDVRLRTTTRTLRRGPLVPRPKRNIPLHPNDRLDTRRLRRLVEIDRRVHIPMIRKRHRRLTQLRRSVHHVFDMTVPIQKRILGVIVKMYELVRQPVSAPP